MLTKVAKRTLERLALGQAQIYRVDMGINNDALYHLVYHNSYYTKVSSGTFHYLYSEGFITARTDLHPEKGETIYDISPLGREALKQ